MDIEHKRRYLKYKKKYLELKQSGGSQNLEQFLNQYGISTDEQNGGMEGKGVGEGEVEGEVGIKETGNAPSGEVKEGEVGKVEGEVGEVGEGKVGTQETGDAQQEERVETEVESQSQPEETDLKAGEKLILEKLEQIIEILNKMKPISDEF